MADVLPPGHSLRDEGDEPALEDPQGYTLPPRGPTELEGIISRAGPRPTTPEHPLFSMQRRIGVPESSMLLYEPPGIPDPRDVGGDTGVIHRMSEVTGADPETVRRVLGDVGSSPAVVRAFREAEIPYTAQRIITNVLTSEFGPGALDRLYQYTPQMKEAVIATLDEEFERQGLPVTLIDALHNHLFEEDQKATRLLDKNYESYQEARDAVNALYLAGRITDLRRMRRLDNIDFFKGEGIHFTHIPSQEDVEKGHLGAREYEHWRKIDEEREKEIELVYGTTPLEIITGPLDSSWKEWFLGDGKVGRMAAQNAEDGAIMNAYEFVGTGYLMGLKGGAYGIASGINAASESLLDHVTDYSTTREKLDEAERAYSIVAGFDVEDPHYKRATAVRDELEEKHWVEKRRLAERYEEGLPVDMIERVWAWLLEKKKQLIAQERADGKYPSPEYLQELRDRRVISSLKAREGMRAHQELINSLDRTLEGWVDEGVPPEFSWVIADHKLDPKPGELFGENMARKGFWSPIDPENTGDYSLLWNLSQSLIKLPSDASLAAATSRREERDKGLALLLESLGPKGVALLKETHPALVYEAAARAQRGKELARAKVEQNEAMQKFMDNDWKRKGEQAYVENAADNLKEFFGGLSSITIGIGSAVHHMFSSPEGSYKQLKKVPATVDMIGEGLHHHFANYGSDTPFFSNLRRNPFWVGLDMLLVFQAGVGTLRLASGMRAKQAIDIMKHAVVPEELHVLFPKQMKEFGVRWQKLWERFGKSELSAEAMAQESAILWEETVAKIDAQYIKDFGVADFTVDASGVARPTSKAAQARTSSTAEGRRAFFAQSDELQQTIHGGVRQTIKETAATFADSEVIAAKLEGGLGTTKPLMHLREQAMRDGNWQPYLQARRRQIRKSIDEARAEYGIRGTERKQPRPGKPYKTEEVGYAERIGPERQLTAGTERSQELNRQSKVLQDLRIKTAERSVGEPVHLPSTELGLSGIDPFPLKLALKMTKESRKTAKYIEGIRATDLPEQTILVEETLDSLKLAGAERSELGAMLHQINKRIQAAKKAEPLITAQLTSEEIAGQTKLAVDKYVSTIGLDKMASVSGKEFHQRIAAAINGGKPVKNPSSLISRKATDEIHASLKDLSIGVNQKASKANIASVIEQHARDTQVLELSTPVADEKVFAAFKNAIEQFDPIAAEGLRPSGMSGSAMYLTLREVLDDWAPAIAMSERRAFIRQEMSGVSQGERFIPMPGKYKNATTFEEYINMEFPAGKQYKPREAPAVREYKTGRKRPPIEMEGGVERILPPLEVTKKASGPFLSEGTLPPLPVSKMAQEFGEFAEGPSLLFGGEYGKVLPTAEQALESLRVALKEAGYGDMTLLGKRVSKKGPSIEALKRREQVVKVLQDVGMAEEQFAKYTAEYDKLLKDIKVFENARQGAVLKQAELEAIVGTEAQVLKFEQVLDYATMGVPKSATKAMESAHNLAKAAHYLAETGQFFDPIFGPLRAVNRVKNMLLNWSGRGKAGNAAKWRYWFQKPETREQQWVWDGLVRKWPITQDNAMEIMKWSERWAHGDTENLIYDFKQELMKIPVEHRPTILEMGAQTYAEKTKNFTVDWSKPWGERWTYKEGITPTREMDRTLSITNKYGDGLYDYLREEVTGLGKKIGYFDDPAKVPEVWIPERWIPIDAPQSIVDAMRAEFERMLGIPSNKQLRVRLKELKTQLKGEKITQAEFEKLAYEARLELAPGTSPVKEMLDMLDSHIRGQSLKHNKRKGLITEQLEVAKAHLDNGSITQAEYNQLKYALEKRSMEMAEKGMMGAMGQETQSTHRLNPNIVQNVVQALPDAIMDMMHTKKFLEWQQNPSMVSAFLDLEKMQRPTYINVERWAAMSKKQRTARIQVHNERIRKEGYSRGDIEIGPHVNKDYVLKRFPNAAVDDKGVWWIGSIKKLSKKAVAVENRLVHTEAKLRNHGALNGMINGSVGYNLIYSNAMMTYHKSTAGKITRYFKISKTAYSQPTHGTNTIGNTMYLGPMAGLWIQNPAEWPTIAKVVRDMVTGKKSTMDRLFTESGGLGGRRTMGRADVVTNANKEVGLYMDGVIGGVSKAGNEGVAMVKAWLELKSAAKSGELAKQMLEAGKISKGLFDTLIGMPLAIYNAEDYFFKRWHMYKHATKFMKENNITNPFKQMTKARRRAIFTPMIDKALRAFADYDEIAGIFQWVRNSPIGKAFIGFDAAMGPEVAQWASRHPHKMWPLMALGEYMGLVNQMEAGHDPDVMDAAVRNMPESEQRKIWLSKISPKLGDMFGGLTRWNVMKYAPIYDKYMPRGKELTDIKTGQFPTGYIRRIFMAENPIFSGIAYMHNIDPYFGKVIIEEGDTALPSYLREELLMDRFLTLMGPNIPGIDIGYGYLREKAATEPAKPRWGHELPEPLALAKLYRWTGLDVSVWNYSDMQKSAGFLEYRIKAMWKFGWGSGPRYPGPLQRKLKNGEITQEDFDETRDLLTLRMDYMKAALQNWVRNKDAFRRMLPELPALERIKREKGKDLPPGFKKAWKSYIERETGETWHPQGETTQ